MIRTFLARALLVFGSLAVALLLCELTLYLISIPGIKYNVSTYDPLTGSALYPHSTLIYRNERGDTARRQINSVGYPDVEHDVEKGNGVFRIGFFGDSYTEAQQVPLDATFFRLIENRLRDMNVETLAFGVSGYSTLQSYLTFTKWAEHFDLDLVVYVFVDNDPGDNVPELKAYANIPYPKLVDGELTVDESFRAANADKESVAFRFGDYLTSRSLVLSTLSDRISLLRQHGVKRTVTAEDRWMATGADGISASDRVLTSDNSPSTWPPELVERASRMTEAVLRQWTREAADNEQQFAVLYVPRAQEMSKASAQQDSWKPWLEAYCRDNHITLLDPSAELLAAENSGKEVFYDHFTADGHDAFANAFVNWYKVSYQ